MQYRRRHRLIFSTVVASIVVFVAFTTVRQRQHFNINTPVSHYRLIETLRQLEALGQGRGELAERIRASIPTYHGKPWLGLCRANQVRTVEDFQKVVSSTPSLRKEFADFKWEKAHLITAPADKPYHVSYYQGGTVAWTRRKITVKKGESLITDGRRTVRTFCCNELSEVSNAPTLAELIEPSPEQLQPEGFPPEAPSAAPNLTADFPDPPDSLHDPYWGLGFGTPGRIPIETGGGEGKPGLGAPSGSFPLPVVLFPGPPRRLPNSPTTVSPLPSGGPRPGTIPEIPNGYVPPAAIPPGNEPGVSPESPSNDPPLPPGTRPAPAPPRIPPPALPTILPENPNFPPGPTLMPQAPPPPAESVPEPSSLSFLVLVVVLILGKQILARVKE